MKLLLGSYLFLFFFIFGLFANAITVASGFLFIRESPTVNEDDHDRLPRLLFGWVESDMRNNETARVLIKDSYDAVPFLGICLIRLLLEFTLTRV